MNRDWIRKAEAFGKTCARCGREFHAKEAILRGVASRLYGFKLANDGHDTRAPAALPRA
jgi:hypothetical protein